jgi:hypothetical protein
VGLLTGAFAVAASAWLAARGQLPGLATAIAVHAILPLTAVAVWHPAGFTAALGGVLTYAALALGGLAVQWPQFWQWSPSTAVTLAHPILPVGALASAGLAALVVSPWRVVGLPPDPARCPGCGDARGELPRCPECGAARK